MELKKLYNTIGLSGISAIIKIITGVGIIKLIALFIGPEGLAVIGNLKDFLTPANSLAAGGIDNGITKYISSKKDKKIVLNSAFAIAIITSTLIFGIIYFNASTISIAIFRSISYSDIIRFFSFSIPISAFNLILIKYLNGLEKYKKVIAINIFTNIIVLMVSIPLIITYNLQGAIISLLVTPLVSFIATLIFSRNEFSFHNITISKTTFFNNRFIWKLLSFSLISITSMIVTPITQFSIRHIIINKFNLNTAGIWEAINLISNNFFIVVSLTLSLIILPEFSKVKTNKETSFIIKTLLKNFYPLFILGLILLYIYRETIVQLLFSSQFYKINQYIGIQLIGDAIKFIAWIFGMYLIAKAKTKYFIYKELIASAFYILAIYISIYYWGTIGVFYAYIADYTIRFALVFHFYKKTLADNNI